MNGKPSRALEFFEQVKTAGPSFLKKLIDSDPPTFETDWLDFKGGERLDEKNVKKIWSEALSGFANTEGGVLVWGIDARKDPETGVDHATRLSLVKNPETFVSRLKELHSKSTDPPISGVDFWFSTDDTSPDSGFIVCYVPESKFKPIRAEAADRNYYIRAGDSFHVPSVALLRSLFFPEYHSHLWPELSASYSNSGIGIDVCIHNSGIATAKNVMVSIRSKPSLSWDINPLGKWQFIGIFQPEPRLISGLSSPLPVHPGMALPALRLLQRIPPHEFEEFIQVKFEIFMYSDNNHPLFSSITFTHDEFEDKTAKCGKSVIFEIERRGF
jgi:hypothetical protein